MAIDTVTLTLITVFLGGILGGAITYFYLIVSKNRRLQSSLTHLFELKSSLRGLIESDMLSSSELKARKAQLQKFRQASYETLTFLDTLDLFIDDLKVDLDAYSQTLVREVADLAEQKKAAKKLHDRLVNKLESAGFMGRNEAKALLLDELKASVRQQNECWIEHSIKEAKEIAKTKATEIIVCAMQRCCASRVTPHSSSTVMLASDDMKGKIIGKDGRNIKTLEMATGMEFIINDSPASITISGFNPLRREVARRVLERLLHDGRINPASIEETTLAVQASLDKEIVEYGRAAIAEFNLKNVHPELIILVGRLYFRTSYTQNVWDHSREVASFAQSMAHELGLDGSIAARAGLFHDIGKALSAEVEGPHALIGAEIAKKYGESNIVVNAIAAHHEEVPYESLYAPLVTIADTISSARPGARKETLAAYIQRTEKLEDIANAFHGVKKSYVFSSGREVRVIVDELELDDVRSEVLARDIAEKIEQELNFPGQIKVHVIRERRVIQYAK